MKLVRMWNRLGIPSQIANLMGPRWGPPGSCQPQMGPMYLAIRDVFAKGLIIALNSTATSNQSAWRWWGMIMANTDIFRPWLRPLAMHGRHPTRDTHYRAAIEKVNESNIIFSGESGKVMGKHQLSYAKKPGQQNPESGTSPLPHTSYWFMSQSCSALAMLQPDRAG